MKALNYHFDTYVLNIKSKYYNTISEDTAQHYKLVSFT